MTQRRLMFSALATFVLACRVEQPKAAAVTSREIAGTAAERVATMRKMLPSLSGITAPILDAHALEVQVGDGNLGPSDFVLYYSFTVRPADLSQWAAALGPAAPAAFRPAYAAPSGGTPWWVAPAAFSRLTFYLGSNVVAVDRGWVGIDRAVSRIYIYRFTQ
jgi:hypothetical protein